MRAGRRRWHSVLDAAGAAGGRGRCCMQHLRSGAEAVQCATASRRPPGLPRVAPTITQLAAPCLQ